jgi:hypothetical protein
VKVRDELKTLVRRRDEATVEVEAARALRDAAHERKPELAEIDGRESLGEIDAPTAARMRGDVESEIAATDDAVARAENVLRYLADRILAEAQRIAAEIERKPAEIVEAARAREAEAEAVLVSRTREREAAEEALADAHVRAEQVLAEHGDSDAQERVRFKREQIAWAVRNGTGYALEQIAPEFRDEAAAEMDARAAEGRARREQSEAALAWPRLGNV